MTAPGFVDPPAVSIWIANDSGLLRTISLPLSNTTDGTSGYSAQLPSGAWRLAAIDVTPTDRDSDWQARTIHLTSIAVAGAALDLGGVWDVIPIGSPDPGLPAAKVIDGFPIDPGPATTRIMPPEDAIRPARSGPSSQPAL